ncbi:hypothetical protein LCGC14_2994000, partial [marine sediment metagenome]
MVKTKMKVETQGGINWVWFKVQNGTLVAVFRLHYGEEPLRAFNKLKKDMTEVRRINVPMATWREKCDLVASHTLQLDGYALPEVVEAFSWLNDMFKETACDFELKACKDEPLRHLQFHGVAIVR